jgi:hypothetical protein
VRNGLSELVPQYLSGPLNRELRDPIGDGGMTPRRRRTETLTAPRGPQFLYCRCAHETEIAVLDFFARSSIFVQQEEFMRAMSSP